MIRDGSPLSEKERKLKRQLRNKRLIGELPFTSDEINNLKAVEEIQNLKAWEQYPNLAAYVTVGIGNLFYKGGDLWSSFEWLDGSNIQSKWGSQFEKYSESHDSLESFRVLKEKGHLRFVAPILAHGGIPQYCLDDFFQLITDRSYPQDSGADFIVDLKDNKNWLTGVDIPVKSFLFYGGQVAESFISRVLGLWSSHEERNVSGNYGLPNRVAKKFGAWFAANPPKESNRTKRLPGPTIKISPGDLWVYLFLPRCDAHPEVDPDSTWYFNDKPLATTRDHEIPLDLRESWNICLNNRSFKFKGITPDIPAIFFNPTSKKMIRDPLNRRLPENLWVVFREKTVTYPEPRYKESLEHWPGCCVGYFDLKCCRLFVLDEKEFEVDRPSFYREEDPVVQNVEGKSGLPVFQEIPDIRWEDEANFSLRKDEVERGNIDIGSDDFKMWFNGPGDYKFTLRKSLGEYIDREFIYLPGLNINFSPEVMWPEAKYVKIDVELKNGHAYTNNEEPPFTAYENPFFFTVETGAFKAELKAAVPKLQWGLRGLPGIDEDASQHWNDQPIELDIRDLEEAEYPRLVVRIDKTTKIFNVSLVGKHGKIDPPKGKHSKVSDKGPWSFDLRRVVDDVLRHGKSEEYNIQMTENGKTHYTGKILSVKPHWNLQKVEAKWKRKDGTTIQVHDGHAKIEDRWLVVISLFQPWEKATTYDLEPGKSRWESESDFAPGRYIVKAVHSPWGPPSDNRHIKSLKEDTFDVNKKDWPEIFDRSQKAPLSLEDYAECLFAYWSNNQSIKCPLPPASSMTKDDILLFLKYLDDYSKISPVNIPKIPLNIFCVNPHATTIVVLSENDLPQLWGRVLPQRKVLQTEKTADEMKRIENEITEYGKKIDPYVEQLEPEGRKNNLYKLGLTEARAREIIFLVEKFKLHENGKDHAFQYYKSIIKPLYLI